MYYFIYYFKVKYSADKLATLQKLKLDNETKLKTLKDSFDIDEIKTNINKKKEEKNRLTLVFM